MKLYTGTGDGGETSLLNGRRVSKSDIRIAAIGEVDELNAMLGWSRACVQPEAVGAGLRSIQDDLFRLGAELAGPADPPPGVRGLCIRTEDAARLEAWIDEACAAVPPLRHFILPGGSEGAARLHVARAVCRRAERVLVMLSAADRVSPESLVYLNRLGDLLFAWARLSAVQARAPEILWKPSM